MSALLEFWSTLPDYARATVWILIVTVAVKAGQAVKPGDPLLSIEAMKMETQIRAEREGVVKAVHARPGDTVAARDLLVEMRA